MKKFGYVYMLTNKNKSVLYIGMTSNLERRIYEHRNRLIPGFTKKYNLHHLVYFEKFDSIVEAIRMEKSLKGKLRSKKEALISASNPNWIDLSDTL